MLTVFSIVPFDKPQEQKTKETIADSKHTHTKHEKNTTCILTNLLSFRGACHTIW